MALRKRMIDPYFLQDDKVLELEPVARLFFILLWIKADDEGRFRLEIDALRGLCFPNDAAVTSAHIKKWIDQMTAMEMLQVYPGRQVDTGKRGTFVQIVNFLRHQKINHPTKSVCPAPPDLRAEDEIDPEPQPLVSYSKSIRSTPVSLRSVKEHSGNGTGDLPEVYGNDRDEFSTTSRTLREDYGSSTGELREASPQLVSQLVSKLEDPSPPQSRDALNSIGGSGGNGAVDGAENGKTVAPSARGEPLAHESTLHQLTINAIGLLEIPNSPAIYAAVASALVACHKQQQKAYVDAHNAIVSRALIAAQEHKPDSWVEWFRTGQWQTPT